ncbi:MAG: hypothetical protein QM642_06615 [Edaphocola sp.]
MSQLFIGTISSATDADHGLPTKTNLAARPFNNSFGATPPDTELMKRMCNISIASMQACRLGRCCCWCN